MLNSMPTEDVTAPLAALADPTGRAIPERWASGEISVTEPADPVGIEPSAVSRRIGLLARSAHFRRSSQDRVQGPARPETIGEKAGKARSAETGQMRLRQRNTQSTLDAGACKINTLAGERPLKGLGDEHC
jgi:hypothetical protein